MSADEKTTGAAAAQAGAQSPRADLTDTAHSSPLSPVEATGRCWEDDVEEAPFTFGSEAAAAAVAATPSASPPPATGAATSFSQERSRRTKSSAVVMPDLEAHPIISPEFDEQFRQRLRSISRRNRNDSLSTVLDQRDRLLATHQRRMHEHEEASRRRHERAEALHQQLMLEKRWLENQQRTKQWAELLIATSVARHLHRELLVHHAFAKLRDRFRPMLVRKKRILERRRARRGFTAESLGENPRPTASMLTAMQGDFFRDWSPKELDDLIQHMTPRSFRAGEFIMFAGDFDREMYVLVKGRVLIMLPKKNSGNKRRTSANAVTTIAKDAPCYFGEFALLCKEPRSASIQCEADCHLWVVSQPSFARELQFLSPQVAATLQVATDKRRKQNLQNYFPLRIEVLRKQPFLAHWDTAMLQELATALEPHVNRADTIVFREGDYQPVLFVVGDGTVRLFKESDPSNAVDLGPGECFGVFETLFTHERRPMSAVCITSADLWSITRQRLIDIAMDDPDAMIKTRRIVQQMKASSLTKSPKPAPFFSNDPYIQWFLTPNAQQSVWAAAEPRVHCTNEVLFRENEDFKGIFIIALGTFAISFSSREFQGCDDEASINPTLYGVHSTKHDDNANLARLFPSVPLCDAPTFDGVNKPLSPTLMRLKSDVSAFIFLRNSEHRAVQSSPTHATCSASGGAMMGVVLGAFEMASRRSRHTCTVRCVTQCDVWFIKREAVEACITSRIATAMDQPRSISHVIDAHNRRDAAVLYLDHPLKPAATLHHPGHHQQHARSAPAPGPVKASTPPPPVAGRHPRRLKPMAAHRARSTSPGGGGGGRGDSRTAERSRPADAASGRPLRLPQLHPPGLPAPQAHHKAHRAPPPPVF